MKTPNEQAVVLVGLNVFGDGTYDTCEMFEYLTPSEIGDRPLIKAHRYEDDCTWVEVLLQPDHPLHADALKSDDDLDAWRRVANHLVSLAV